jgi:hypothetical protein
MRCEPDVGEQFVELLCGMGRQATEDVGEVGERIDVVMMTGASERIQDGRRTAATVTPQKRPVLEVMLSSALTALCPVPDYAESTYAGPQSPGSA